MAAGFLWLHFLSRHLSDELMEIAGALETLGPARRVGIGHKTGPIFITVDPERDTPDVRRNTPRRSIHASLDLPQSATDRRC